MGKVSAYLVNTFRGELVDNQPQSDPYFTKN